MPLRFTNVNILPNYVLFYFLILWAKQYAELKAEVGKNFQEFQKTLSFIMGNNSSTTTNCFYYRGSQDV